MSDPESLFAAPFHPDRDGCDCKKQGLTLDDECVHPDPCWIRRDYYEKWKKRNDHDHKGFSEERCVRCGWVMGQPAKNCQNDDTPHRFPSQEQG